MNKTVRIGERRVGSGQATYVIGEIGINHNGSLDTAMKLIEAAKSAGCDAVKFQKRTVKVVYSAEELAKPRENPFGPTNGDLKHGLEFGKEEYEAIDAKCKELGLHWFASCWNEASVDFIGQFDVPCFKIASASLTDDELLKHHRTFGKPIIISTGMSSLEEIDHAIEVLGREDLILLHTTSSYPCKLEELNLKAIVSLRERYQLPIGYSGHETGLAPSEAAVVLGACVVERHITLDRAMWGSDQAASVEPQGMSMMVRHIRAIEQALGDGEKVVYDSEVPVREKLRRK